ncbi:MAG: DPP IV N-terminal domain-containing protein, partial [Gemmatimonadaceae bacterium]
MRLRPAFLLALPFAAAVFVGRAEAQQPFDLSVKNIMRGPELYGREPQNVRFTADGQWLYFQWLAPGATWNTDLEPYRVAARAEAVPERVTAAHMDSIAPLLASGRRLPGSRGNSVREVVTATGDLWLRSRTGTNVTLRRLTQTAANEVDARPSLDGRDVFYVRDQNLFAVDLITGLTRQLTDIRSGAAPTDPKAPMGQRGTLAAQQRFLLETIRDDLAADSIDAARRREAESRRLPIIWIPTAERITGLSISPDGKSALISTFLPATGARGSDVPDYINPDGYPRMIPGRSKVGDAQGTPKVGHLILATGKISWLTLAPDSSAVSSAQLGDWSDDGRFGLLFVVSADFKHRYLWSVASATGAMTLVDALTDDAWVNGPCFGCHGWTPQGKAWFVSEESGYAHLYAVNADGSGKQALTSGAWEVLSAARSVDDASLNLVTSEPSPFTKQAYRMPITGGARTRLTAGNGGHAPVISPVDPNVIATVYSTANTPPELFIARVGEGRMAQLTTSPTPEFRSYAWQEPPIVQLDGEDGVKVPARLYDPKRFGVTPNGGAVIFV